MKAVHPMVDGLAPTWASAWGEDEYGCFAVLTVGEVQARFRWIPPGTFVMGSPETEAGREDNEVQHEVTLMHGYWLGETPVTQALWEVVGGEGSNLSEFHGAERPVENVNWADCQAFIARLREIVPAFDGRLPTEAEWERACRAGTTSATWVGELTLLGSNHAPELDAIAWYGGNSGAEFKPSQESDSIEFVGRRRPHRQMGTHPVGTRSANPWGLRDMLGNVWEWCSDGFAPYAMGPSIDPRGASSDDERVLRGGSWGTLAKHVRAASRGWYDPEESREEIGFRLLVGPGSGNSGSAGT